MTDLAGRKLGDFVLREQIGEGGCAVVSRCEQPQRRRSAVVKVLHERGQRSDAALDRFRREAQLASQLDHPYAAHVYAFGDEDDGLFWIAMELVQGTALDDWLVAHGPMPLAQFVPFFENVADVVHAAHERGIIHPDLKPSNVMVISWRDRPTRVWDTVQGRQLAELPSASPIEGSFASAVPVVSDGGDRIAIARGSVVQMYGLPGGQLLRSIDHPAAISAVAFALTGRDLVSGAVDGSVRVTRDDGAELMLHASSGVDAVGLLPDGRVIDHPAAISAVAFALTG